MNHPDDLLYTRGDWWLREEGGALTLGLSSWKANELGEIVFLELPSIGASVQSEQSVGVVESVKSVSDLHAPFAGTIERVNHDLDETPSLINEDPYARGWIFALRPSDPQVLESALTPLQYAELRGLEPLEG